MGDIIFANAAVLDGANSPGCFGISQILAGPVAAGRWVGIQNGIGNFAGVIAPALTGFLVGQSQHFTSAFLVAAAFCLTLRLDHASTPALAETAAA